MNRVPFKNLFGLPVVRCVALVFIAAAPLAAPADDDGLNDAARPVQFAVREERADKALIAFARQAGLSVLFSYDAVSALTANPLVGVYQVEEGLNILLEGTGLEADLQEGDRLSVRVEEPRRRPDSGKARKGFFSGLLSRFSAPFRGDAGSPRQEEDARPALEEITVTGTRIRRDDFSSAQPTTVVDAQMLDALGVVNFGDAMAQLPSNLASWTPTAKPGGNESFPLNVFNGLHLANLRGLNPTFGSRTLTLVDSRRHVPTNQGDGVDLNMIPAVLIDRVEVVTGGASASYGSGAIGGVVNILLDHDFDGAKAQFDVGRTEEGDGNDTHYAFAWGGPVGDTGRFVLGVENQEMEAISQCIESRAWCAKGAQVRNNFGFWHNDEPNFVYREGVRADMSTTGVLPFLGFQFDEAGSGVVPYRPASPYGVGGDGQHIYLDLTLRSNVDRRIGYGRYEHRLGSGLNVFVEGSAADVTSFTPQDSFDLFLTPLAPDNYYLNRLSTNPCASSPHFCFISKDFSAQSDSANDTRTSMRRAAVGVGGSLGESTWTWDAYYQHGRSETLQAVHDSRHAVRMQFALDAVDDGAGNPVCRVTRDGVNARFNQDARLAEGCVPINIFGLGNITPEAFDYTHGRIVENTDVTQKLFEFVASGSVFRGFGAGDMRAAAGFSWRDESLDNIADQTQPDYIRRDYNSQYGETFGGDVEVLEYFGELDIPVTERFDLQLAGRHSGYRNTAGIGTGIAGRTFKYDIDTWKISGNWRASDWLTLRASRSRDIRAPNFRELYFRKVLPEGSAFGYCDNPWTGNRFLGWYTHTGDPCVNEMSGGHELTPEEADTSTIGVVLMPSISNLRFAADYYQIKIADAISPANFPLVLNGCFRDRDPTFCSQIEGPLLDPDDPLGGFAKIDRVRPEAMNLLAYETSGVDISADWARDFDFGTISSRLLGSRVIEQLVQPNAAFPWLFDVSGVTGSPGGGADWEPAPDWSAQWATTYARGPFRLTTHARYVSDGKKHALRRGPEDAGFDPSAPGSIDDNRVPSYVVWALSGSYDLNLMGTRMQLFGSVQNLFDREPPLIGMGPGGTNPVFFDTLGRSYRFGIRADF